MPDRNQKMEARRNYILQTLRRDGKVSVTQLSAALNATAVTIRTDLANLERDGYLTRVQGGAIPTRDALHTDAPEQDIPYYTEKHAIAAVIAEQIRDGDTLFINCGTTSVCVAQALRARRNLSIVTNSLAVAAELGAVPTFRVLLLGGVVNARYGFTYGSDAQEQLNQYQADWAVLSVDGVSAKGGITTYHAEEAILDRMMMQGAGCTLIAADHSKIGRAGFTRVRDCAPPLCLVTDCADPKALAELQEQGMRILNAAV